MAQGILKHGFVIRTHTHTIKIPKFTMVTFHSSRPTILFHHLRIRLFKDRGEWFADIFGKVFSVVFDRKNPPYPISYYK